MVMSGVVVSGVVRSGVVKSGVEKSGVVVSGVEKFLGLPEWKSPGGSHGVEKSGVEVSPNPMHTYLITRHQNVYYIFLES